MGRDGVGMDAEQESERMIEELEESFRRSLKDHHSTEGLPILFGKYEHCFTRAILNGLGSMCTLFPATPYRFRRFRHHYESLDDPIAEDWLNVGADLFRAMMKAKLLDHVNAQRTRESEPADPARTR